MKSAQKQETLVQLSNLDPAYTSKQVEVMSILCKEMFVIVVILRVVYVLLEL